MGDGKEKKSMTEREMMRKRAAARKERERKARNRRVVLTVALMLVVCIASVGGTIAWLTDQSGSVVNTFSPSDINISLTEEGVTLDADENGSKSVKMVPGTAANIDTDHIGDSLVPDGHGRTDGTAFACVNVRHDSNRATLSEVIVAHATNLVDGLLLNYTMEAASRYSCQVSEEDDAGDGIK